MVNEKRWAPAEGFILAENEDRILSDVVKKTGFVVKERLRAGAVYDAKKVRDVVYTGTYDGKDAILKIKGLKVDSSELPNIEAFNKQNRSKIVRIPQIYSSMRYNARKGYEYIIFEYIRGKWSWDAPFAGKDDIREFAKFYQEYRINAITKDFLPKKRGNPLSYQMMKVDFWRSICESTGRLRLEQYAPWLMRYYPIAVKNLADIPLVLSHSVLADNVLRDDNNSYVLLSNNLWGYMYQWADLTMPLWVSLLNIRDTGKSFEDVLGHVNNWTEILKSIPVVKEDPDFDRKFSTHMLNRCIGTMLADLGAGHRWGLHENRELLGYLVALNQKLFDHFAGKLESKNQ